MWNPVIQFWHGRPLGRIERLSLASFVAQGHEVRLYSYGPLERVPRGVQCVDAREILPEKRLYFDTRHGSWAQFSDIFRFEALRKLGGLWADSDMIALRPIEKAHEVLIVRESRSQLASALVGIPAGHPLARRLVWGVQHPWLPHRHDPWKVRLQKTARLVRREPPPPIGWADLGPKLLTQVVADMGLMHLVEPTHNYLPYAWSDPVTLPFEPPTLEFMAAVMRSKTVHMWQYMIDRAGLDADAAFAENSLFETWWRRFQPDA